jgi:polyisoprenyl-teichoic acid--peptidoglycan teichoic acid transferase
MDLKLWATPVCVMKIRKGTLEGTDRQRQVIQAVMGKGKSLTTVTNINKILGAVGSNVQTNLTLKDMEKLATNYRQCRQNVTNYEVQGTPKYIGGVSWVLVSNQEFNHVNGLIASELSKN